MDPEVPIEESLAVLEASTATRAASSTSACPTMGVDQIERARSVVPIAAVQNEYNLSERKYEDVVDLCEREEILFVPYYPLHGPGRAPLDEVASRYDATPEQIVLAWLLKRSPASSRSRARSRSST